MNEFSLFPLPLTPLPITFIFDAGNAAQGNVYMTESSELLKTSL